MRVLFYDKLYLLPRALGSCCYLYIPRNQTISCQYKLSKKTVLHRGTIGLVIRIEIKHLYPCFIAE